MTTKREVRKSLRTNFTPGPRDYLNRVLLLGRKGLHLPALVLKGRLSEPVFIIGAPRSGTSLLYSILRASSHLAHWPGEAHEVWEADFHPALTGWKSNALGREDARGPEGERIKREFLLVAGTRRRLIDKTPRNALRVSFIDELFPDARFVFLTRDGRENVNSLINAWRTKVYRTYRLPEEHSIPGAEPEWWKFTLYPGWEQDVVGPLEVVCARQWHMSYDHALAAAPEGERWIPIRYEDLVADAVSEVARVASALELPFEDVMRGKAESVSTTPINAVTPPERGKWRRENPEEIEAILPLITPTMKRLGYEIED